MPIPQSRRGLLAGTAAMLAAGAPRAEAAWPNRAVRLVVGFTAGSSTDITARLFAQRFTEAWGQPVVVDNVPGNGGAIGVERVARAAPDGYTLLWCANGALTIVPSLQAVSYDPLKDLEPIGITLAMPSLILVNTATPWRDLPMLVAEARANPGRLSFGSPGVGTPQHIAGEMLCHQAGIRMEHIPYRGANLGDLLNGVVPISIQNAGAALPMVQAGQVRCIAITALARSANAPAIPTVAEQGFPGFEALSWFGLMAPAGTPAEIGAKVHAAALRALADGDLRGRIAALGLEPVGGSAEAMRATIAADLPRWAKVIAAAGIAVAR